MQDPTSEAMKKFEFLIGNWDLEYRIPKSAYSKGGSDSGSGTIKRVLGNKYVIFDYSTKSGGKAHGIFAWDQKAGVYRYWWFENSGSFLTATCDFVNADTLCLNWHDTLLVQTFAKHGSGEILLRMEHPVAQEGRELLLEVLFTRRTENAHLSNGP